ncbi:TFIIS helical bundle-like domain family protein [Babesia bovis T2Bo]|nr:TFIIS helical bundle-like domain family protein [Babesia bovis T2Bo]EDO06306.1 TFIIS helical bundle-like domain family protein [Babesia bovis T2Bo]|eukprot:XP_001609874.1 hypothetical protein [Babesia bovis T2Bo]
MDQSYDELSDLSDGIETQNEPTLQDSAPASPTLEFDDVEQTEQNHSIPSESDNENTEHTVETSGTPNEDVDSTAEGKNRLSKKAFIGKDEDYDTSAAHNTSDSSENIKVPKKTSLNKKNRSKKNHDIDGDFIPPTNAFDKNHLDADYDSDNDVSERKVQKKKNATAGKIYFDEVLKRVKERRKKTVQMTPEECQHYCRQLIDRMLKAASDDLAAVQQGKPGLAKLKMINDLSNFAKPAWRNWCITEGAAVAMAAWISPLPDGTLPNLTVRAKVLEIALLLPFQPSDLRDNDLGRQIVALWKHPDETDANRVLIRSIVQKWVRPMLGLASSYADIQQDYTINSKSNVLSMEGDVKERKMALKYAQHKAQMGSIIVNQERINSKLSQLFKGVDSKRKIPNRATKVSIDGTSS